MEIVPVSALRDNYIWALCEGADCVVVDPGEAAPVSRFLARADLNLTAILLTHRHHDHIDGVAGLLEEHEVPVFGPDSPAIPQVTHKVAGGDVVSVPGLGLPLRVIAVPGHTEEHIAWHIDGAIFCGDTLFGAGCGRLLGGTAAQLHASLQRLANLPPETRVFCAHEYTLANLRFALTVEPENRHSLERLRRCESLRAAEVPTLPSTMSEELATNPFLRTREPAVRRAAEQVTGGASLRSDLEVFATLRSWKDRF